MVDNWSNEENKISDELFDKWGNSDKEFNRNYQRFRRYIKTTKEYKMLKAEEEKLEKLKLEKKRELREYSIKHLPDEIIILKLKKEKSYEAYNDYNQSVWEKHEGL